MAKADSKAIPAKRGTKRARTRRVAPQPEPESQATPLATLVEITPANRIRDGYREADVIAVNAGVIGGRLRKKGDLFRIGVIGNGPLPPSVRAA